MIQHKILESSNSIHSFYEESEYNKEHPELTNFGFDILVTWKFMPSLLYILIKGGEFDAIDRRWKRHYSFDLESKCLTQIFKESRAKEDVVVKILLRDDEIKDLCELISKTQREYRAEMVEKIEKMKKKISDTMIYNNKIKQSKPADDCAPF